MSWSCFTCLIFSNHGAFSLRFQFQPKLCRDLPAWNLAIWVKCCENDISCTLQEQQTDMTMMLKILFKLPAFFFSLEAIHVVWSCSGIFCQSVVALCTWTHAGSNCWIKHRWTFWPWESQWISVDHRSRWPATYWASHDSKAIVWPSYLRLQPCEPHLQLVWIVRWVSILMSDSTKKWGQWGWMARVHGILGSASKMAWLSSGIFT